MMFQPHISPVKGANEEEENGEKIKSRGNREKWSTTYEKEIEDSPVGIVEQMKVLWKTSQKEMSGGGGSLWPFSIKTSQFSEKNKKFIYGPCTCPYTGCESKGKMIYNNKLNTISFMVNNKVCMAVTTAEGGAAVEEGVQMKSSSKYLKPDQIKLAMHFLDENESLAPADVVAKIRLYNDKPPAQRWSDSMENVLLPTLEQISNLKSRIQRKKIREIHAQNGLGDETGALLAGQISFNAVLAYCENHRAPHNFWEFREFDTSSPPNDATNIAPDFDIHKAFVVAFDVDGDSAKCNVGLSTWVLLNGLPVPAIPTMVNVDTTHCMSKNKTSVLSVGTTDRNRNYHVQILGYSLNETEEETAFFIKEMYMKGKNSPTDLDLLVCMADAAESGPNGVARAYGQIHMPSGQRMMCYAHVHNKQSEHISLSPIKVLRVKQKIVKDAYLTDLNTLAHSPTKAFFDVGKKLFLKLHGDPTRDGYDVVRGAVENLRTFWFLPRVENFYSGASVGNAMTQNGLEGTFKPIKKAVVPANKVPKDLIVSLDKARKYLTDRSLRYTTEVPADYRLSVENRPTRQLERKNANIKLAAEIEAYQYARAIPSVAHPEKSGMWIYQVGEEDVDGDGILSAIHLTVSSKIPREEFTIEKANELYALYNSPKFESFELLRSFRFNVFVIRRVPRQPGYFICSCEDCARLLWCKHTLAIAEAAQAFEFRSEAKAILLPSTVGPRIGRPPNSKVFYKGRSSIATLSSSTWSAPPVVAMGEEEGEEVAAAGTASAKALATSPAGAAGAAGAAAGGVIATQAGTVTQQRAATQEEATTTAAATQSAATQSATTQAVMATQAPATAVKEGGGTGGGAIKRKRGEKK
jgi:hypothetical protein